MEPPQGLSALLTETTVLKYSITTSDGNSGGTTLIDSALTEATNNYWTGTAVILSGACKGQKSDIGSFTAATDTITVGTAFAAKIVSGVRYAILAFEPATVEVAALEAKVDEIPAETGTKTFNAIALQSIQSEAEKALEDAGQVMAITTIATLATQTSFTLTAGSADDDAYNGMVAVIEDASTAAQKAIGVISNYVGGTKTITLREDPAIFTMAATDKISIISVSPDILNILADTNELQTDWKDGGRLDLILDNIELQTEERVAGKIQILEVSVTSAANAAADTVLATATAQPCIAEVVILRADAAQTTDLSSCPIKGCTGKVITFINAGNATQANLDATSKQLTWKEGGPIYLNTGETIVMEHNGTGATALDLTIIIIYKAVADGGYLI